MSNEDRADDTPEDDGQTTATPGGSNTDSTSSSPVSRRTVLRTGVNVGAAGAIVWGLGVANYATPNDLGSITYARARPDPDATELEPRTKDVPVAWHESLRMAFEAQDAIQETGLSPLVSAAVIPGSYDDPEAAISVEATENGIGERLEQVTESVPIDVSVVEEIPPRPDDDPDREDANEIAELDFDGIPGGVLCDSPAESGTLTSALFDAETGERYFGTSNHVYGEEGALEDEHESEPLGVVHADDTYRIGRVVRGYPLADLVQVEPDGGVQPAAEIDRAEPSQVIGQYTQLGLADLMAREESLEKIGALSDHTAGEIKGVNAMTCYTGAVCKPGQLIWGDEDALTDGDSGSVNYHPDPENPDDYVLVGGINNARTWWPGSDFTWGTAAHHLLEEYGLHF